jgi:hypothetical protein
VQGAEALEIQHLQAEFPGLVIDQSAGKSCDADTRLSEGLEWPRTVP